MSEREDFLFNFKIEGINDIKKIVDYLEEYQKIINANKGQEVLTKLKLDVTQFNNTFNAYKSIFEKFESVNLNPAMLTSLNTYVQQLQNLLQPLQSSFQNIIIDQLREREEYTKRVSDAEKNSLKTAKELIEYQREKNKLDQIALENETLKNKLINSNREVAKISLISDTEKQTQLGLSKLDVSNKSALVRESTGEPIKIRLALQNDLNSALKNQIKLEEEILQLEKNKIIKSKENLDLENSLLKQKQLKDQLIQKESILKFEDAPSALGLKPGSTYMDAFNKVAQNDISGTKPILSKDKLNLLNEKIKNSEKIINDSLFKELDKSLQSKFINEYSSLIEQKINMYEKAEKKLQTIIQQEQKRTTGLFFKQLEGKGSEQLVDLNRETYKKVKNIQPALSGEVFFFSEKNLNNIQGFNNELQEIEKKLSKIITKMTESGKYGEEGLKKISTAYESLLIKKGQIADKIQNEINLNQQLLDKKKQEILEERKQLDLQSKLQKQLEEKMWAEVESDKGKIEKNRKAQESKLFYQEEERLKKEKAKSSQSDSVSYLNQAPDAYFKGQLEFEQKQIEEKMWAEVESDKGKIEKNRKAQESKLFYQEEERLKKEKAKSSQSDSVSYLNQAPDAYFKGQLEFEQKQKKGNEELKKNIELSKVQNQEAKKLLEIITQETAQEIIQTLEQDKKNKQIQREIEFKKQLLERKAIRDKEKAQSATMKSGILISSFGGETDKDVSKIISKTKQKEIDDFSKKADQVDKNITSLSKKTKNFTLPINEARQSFQSLTTDINLAGNTLNLFGQYMFSIGKAAVEEAAEWEVLRSKLATFTGSAEEAHSRFKELVTLGLTTPFEIKGLLQAEILLRSFGNETRDLLPQVVNLASAMGKDVDKAAYAVARAMSGASLGFLMLQKTWGISYLKLKELGAEFRSTGQIMASSVKTQNALKLALDELSGSADRLSRTYKGQLSNLSDAISVLREQAGQQLLPVATELVKTLRWILDILDGIPTSIKSVVVGGAILAGTLGMVVGGFANMIWQVGNLIQGIGAMGRVFPALISYLSNTAILAPKVAVGVSTLGMKLATVIPIANGVALSVGGIVLGLGALIGSLALAAYWHKIYEERQKQLQEDELALAELHRRQGLEELSISLGKVTSVQDAYNKIISKSKSDLASVNDINNVFNKILIMQNQELEKRNKLLGESNELENKAKTDKEFYESNSNETRIRQKPLGFMEMIYKMITGPFSGGIAMESSKEGSPEARKQINEEIKNIQKENEKLEQQKKNKLTEGIIDTSAQQKIDKNNEQIKFLKSQENIQQLSINLAKKDIEIQNEKSKELQKQVQLQQEQINLTKYNQLEVQRIKELYRGMSDELKKITDDQKLKKGLRPEVVFGMTESLQNYRNNFMQSYNVTDKQESAYNKGKSKEEQFFKDHGRYPGQAPGKDSKDLLIDFTTGTSIIPGSNPKLEKSILNREKENFYSSTGMSEEEFNRVGSKMSEKNEIDRNLKMLKAFQPANVWDNFKELKKLMATKGYGSKEEEFKHLQALQQSIDEGFSYDYNAFNEENSSKEGSGKITKAQSLENFKNFLLQYDSILNLNLKEKNKLWQQYYNGIEALEKEHARVSADMAKDIAAATPSKFDDIEAQKKASIITLNQEYEERRKKWGDTLQLYAWYAAQRKTIDQKAHEDTMKEINAEYEERVNLYTRAQVAQTKLGSLSEKRARSEQDYTNEQAKAYIDYTATKERLIKEQKFEELSKLEIAYLGESKKRNEQHLENIKKIILDELQVRTDLANTMAEHNRKMGEFTDEHSLKVQRESAIAIVNYLKSEATQYEKMAENGDELTDSQRNTLSIYISQEEKLKEINTTLDYRLNAEGQIYDTAYKTFNDRLSLAVSEKKVSEDIATASRAVFIGKQVEFEKTKMALLEQKELTGKITDAERTVLDAMRQRRSEYANISSSIGGFNEKIRSAVSQAAVLKYELTHGADATGIMSDKFKQAYEHAKALLEQVRTIGNITAGANQFGNMGEFSSLEDMIKTQGKFGVDKDGAAKWKAELALKQGIGNDVPDPYKVGREELEKQREELKKRLESGRETESVMKGLEAQIKDLDNQLMEGLATQNMTVTATNVSINGENVEGGDEQNNGGGEQPNIGKTPEEIAKEEEAKKNKGTTVENISSPSMSTINENTPKTTASLEGTSDEKQARSSNEYSGMYYNAVDSGGGKNEANIKKVKELNRQYKEAWDKTDDYIKKNQMSNKYGNWLKTLGISEQEAAKIGYDNPSNDAMASKSGAWAVRTINKSVVDYTHNFLKGMVSQNRDNLKAIAGGVTNNNQNNSSNRNEIHNHYNLNLDGKTINNNNNPLQKSVRETVSLSLAAKTLR